MTGELGKLGQDYESQGRAFHVRASAETGDRKM